MNCVLMFTGWGGRIMGAKPSHIQEALSSRDCKVHIFNDTKKKLFLHGADGYRGTKKLQEHLQDIVLESSYTVALTSSGGGYAGIRYCIDAGVDCIVGFSVFTTADEAARAADPRSRARISPWTVPVKPSGSDRRSVSNLIGERDGAAGAFFFRDLFRTPASAGTPSFADATLT